MVTGPRLLLSAREREKPKATIKKKAILSVFIYLALSLLIMPLTKLRATVAAVSLQSCESMNLHFDLGDSRITGGANAD